MPRKVLDPVTDTTNWQKVQDYIEERVLQGKLGGIDLLLRDVSHPISQRPFLRLGKPFQIDSYLQKVAAACQLRGKVVESPCNNCKNGHGPFQQCVYLKGYNRLTQNCCGNCRFLNKTSALKGQTACSLRQCTLLLLSFDPPNFWVM
jgi:hypothetical protein